MALEEPTPEERVAATRRPHERALMGQTWSELLFLHWRVDAGEVRRTLPAGLDLDTYDGEAWVGLVPFRVSRSRLSFLPAVPGLSRFDEVNVRTYVHHGGRDPGVWFFSLDASSRLAALGGRSLYRLPYRFSRMTVKTDGGGLSFASDRVRPGPVPATCAMRYRASGEVRGASPGTLEHFLLERYLLYASSRQGLLSARVFHEPYPIQPGTVDGLAENLVVAAGLPRPAGHPLVHYAAAVRVEIFPLVRVES